MRKWIPALLALMLAGCSTLVVQPPGDIPPPSKKEAQPSPDQPNDAAQAMDDGAGVTLARANLPSLGPAPELENEVWLNSDGPLRLSELRGQVVLLDMWTFG